MDMILDHIFILVEPGAEVADQLIAAGLIEGSSNTHLGQGTANRRFYFKNGMLELLYVRDAEEARRGPARLLCFPERTNNPDASPFGLILHAQDQPPGPVMPFPGWSYQPEYFPPPLAFHVGKNATKLREPLCIYVPFDTTQFKPEAPGGGRFHTLTHVNIHSPSLSETLLTASRAERLSIVPGPEHLMEITFDSRENHRHDFRPHLPLIIHG
ncbi:MAG: VOC family protein [Gammaproteobacteria bacterium]|nr:VOC family protein [Gammaproteobacteria bacterium]